MFCIFLLCLLSSYGTLITLRRILQTNRCAEQMFLTDRNKRVEMQRARIPVSKWAVLSGPEAVLNRCVVGQISNRPILTIYCFIICLLKFLSVIIEV